MATPGSTTWKRQQGSHDFSRPVNIYILEPCMWPLPQIKAVLTKEEWGDFVMVRWTSHGCLSQPLPTTVINQLERQFSHWEHLKLLDSPGTSVIGYGWGHRKLDEHGVQGPKRLWHEMIITAGYSVHQSQLMAGYVWLISILKQNYESLRAFLAMVNKS